MDDTAATYIPIEILKFNSGSSCSMERLIVPMFVVGPENAESVNILGGMDYASAVDASPIVLYGPAKSGKSVLASGLAARITKGFETRSAATWVSGSEFCKQFAHASLTDDLAAFRRRFRGCRCMILDGLEGLARSEAAQKELVHVLDAKQSSNTVFISTASCVPATLRGLSASLVSRLMGGLSLEIRLPDHETRRELLRLLCDQWGTPLSSRDREFLLSSLPPSSTAEDMRTALNVMMRQHREKADVKGRAPKFEEWIAHQHERNAIDISEIAKAVAKLLGVSLADLKGTQRKASFVRARGLAIYLARNLCDLSLQEIGEYFGGRDHSTILHAYRKTKKAITGDPELARVSHELQHRWQDRKNA